MRPTNMLIIALALTLVIIAITPHNQVQDQNAQDVEQEDTSALHEKEESTNDIPIPTQNADEKEQNTKADIAEHEKEEPIEPVKEEKETNTETSKKLIMIHNGKGTMCVNQLKFLEDLKPQYPSLIIEEHLTTEQGTMEILKELKSNYTESEGISKTFGYLPITFINNHAYSGFSQEVKEKLQKDIHEICKN